MGEFDDLIPKSDQPDPFADLHPGQTAAVADQVSEPKIQLSPYEKLRMRGVGPGLSATAGPVGTPEEAAQIYASLVQPAIPIPRIQAKSTLGQIAAAPINVVAGLVENIESPVGAATLPLFGSPVGRSAFGALGTVLGLKQLATATTPGEATEGAIMAGISPLIARSSLKEVAKTPTTATIPKWATQPNDLIAKNAEQLSASQMPTGSTTETHGVPDVEGALQSSSESGKVEGSETSTSGQSSSGLQQNIGQSIRELSSLLKLSGLRSGLSPEYVKQLESDLTGKPNQENQGRGVQALTALIRQGVTPKAILQSFVGLITEPKEMTPSQLWSSLQGRFLNEKGNKYASEIGKTETVHGDVRPQQKPAEVVPVQGGEPGIQPQTQAVAESPQISLTPQDQSLLSKSRRGEDLTASEEKRLKSIESKPPVQPATVTTPVTEPVGMGAATPSEFEQPGSFVSNMFAAIDRDRAEAGKPPMEKAPGRTWDQDNQMALSQMNRDPEWIPNLLDEVEKRPRPLLSWENAGLVWHRAKLKAEANNAYRRIAQAFEDGREDDRLEAQIHAAKFEDDLERLDRVVGRGGTGSEAGRTLQAQKMGAGPDFTLVEMRLAKRAANGGRPLTEAESSEIQRLHDELQAKQRAYDEYVARTDARIAELENQSTVDEIRRTSRRTAAPVNLADIRQSTIDKVKAKMDAGQPEDISAYVQKLARALVQSGITDRDALIDAVHSVLKEVMPNITRREAMDALSGYGQFKQLSRDAISQQLRGMKGEMQQLAKLEDMAKGQPPLKTGIQRRTPTDAERKLIKEVNDAKYKFQIPIQDPNTQLKSALDTLKTTLRNRIVDLQDRIDRGDYATRPRRELVLDKDAERLKADAEKVKKEFQRGVALDRLKNRSGLERGADWITRWRRGFILSSPITLAKLTSAAVQRGIITPAEEVIGGAIGKAIPSVAERAPREGGLNVKAESKALTKGLTTGMRDAWDVLRTGESNLDVLYGRMALLPPSVVDFFGHVHGALKAPTKRAEFARSLEKRMQFEINRGVDVSDPMVQSRLIIEAYKDANRSIFLQDNRVVSAYRRAVSALEQKSKLTGKTPVGGKIGATALKILLPIVKVPTNIVAETLQYALGTVTGSARLGAAMAKGVETLKPEQADLILRELKKGSLGAGVMLLGYFNPDVIGGYYQPREKRKPGEPKAGTVKVFGREIPSFLLHNPLLETMQIGATIRRVADSKVKKSSPEEKGVGEGIYAAALGLTMEVPFVREMAEVTKAFNPNEKGAFFGELGKSLVVPQLFQWIATQQDKDIRGNVRKRKPSTILQHIETGIPVLRKNVPLATKP